MAKGTVVLNIVGDDSGLDKTIASAQKKFGAFSDVISGIGLAVGNQLAKLPGMAADFIGDSIGSASDLGEAVSKIDNVFADSSEIIQKWAGTAATSIGQSRQQALEAVGTFGNLLQSLGVMEGPALDMSKSFTGLASDLASFNNTSVDEALVALRSALSGETEPMKRYGVAINDVRLKSEALSLGLLKAEVDTVALSNAQEAVDKATRKAAEALKKSGAESQAYKDAQLDAEQATVKLDAVLGGKLPATLTAAEKAQASYSLIMKSTTLAQGDFARTSSGLANSQRIVEAQFKNVKAEVGQALLPIMTRLMQFVSTELIPAMSNIGPAIQTIIEFFKDASRWVAEHKDYLIAVAAAIGALLVPALVLWAISAASAAAATLAAAAPIIAIIAVIAALAAGVVYAYKHWGWFRDAVDAVASFCKDKLWPVLKQIGEIIGVVVVAYVKASIEYFKILWDIIRTGIDVVVNVATTIFDWFNRVVSFAQELPGRIRGAVSGMWDGIKEAFRSAINWIIDRWNGLEFTIPSINLGPLGSIGGVTIGMPNIPRLATGTVATRPMLGVFGEYPGAAQNPEVVSPVKLMADTFRDVLRENSGRPSVTVHARTSASAKEIADELDWLFMTRRV